MPFYESMQRSAPAFDAIAANLKGYFQQKRNDELRQKMKEMFTERSPVQTEDTMQARAIAPSPEAEEGMRPFRGISQPAPTEPTITGAAADRNLPVTQPVPMQESMRGIESVDDIYKLGDLFRSDPQQTVEAATKFAQSQEPRIQFAPAGSEPFRISKSGDVAPAGGQVPPRTTGAAAKPSEKTIVGKDGFYYKFVPDGKGGGDWQKTNVEAKDTQGNTNKYRALTYEEHVRHDKATESVKQTAGDVFQFDESGTITGINPKATPQQIGSARVNINNNLTSTRALLNKTRAGRESYIGDQDSIDAIDSDIEALQSNIEIYQSMFNALNKQKKRGIAPPAAGGSRKMKLADVKKQWGDAAAGYTDDELIEYLKGKGIEAE